MTIKALNPFAPFWYTPASEQGDEKPTRFKLRGLDGVELGYVSPELQVDDVQGTVSGITGKGLELALKYGLLDWENFENDQGPVKFSVHNFRLIPYVMRAELAMRIIAASYVQEAEKKT